MSWMSKELCGRVGDWEVVSSYVGIWVGHGEVGADDALFFDLAEEGFGESVGHFVVFCVLFCFFCWVCGVWSCFLGGLVVWWKGVAVRVKKGNRKAVRNLFPLDWTCECESLAVFQLLTHIPYVACE